MLIEQEIEIQDVQSHEYYSSLDNVQWINQTIFNLLHRTLRTSKAKYRGMGEINKKHCIDETSFKQTRNGKWINSHQTIL
jgi:hypothetical protein